MGEFGAVSVVSGHIRGLTNTMPLHIELLYNEYNFVGAFSVAALLCLLAHRHPGAEDPPRVQPNPCTAPPCLNRVSAPMTISIRQIEKRFGRYPALNGVSLEIRGRRTVGAARTVGVGQDHAVAH